MALENSGGIQEQTITRDIPLSTERKPDYFKTGGEVVLVNPSYDYIIQTGKTIGNSHDEDHNLDTIKIKLDVDNGNGDTISGSQTNYCGLMTREDYDYLHENPDFAKDWVNKHNIPDKNDIPYNIQKKQENIDKIINAIVNKPLNLDNHENNIMQRNFDSALKEAKK